MLTYATDKFSVTNEVESNNGFEVLFYEPMNRLEISHLMSKCTDYLYEELKKIKAWEEEHS